MSATTQVRPRTSYSATYVPDNSNILSVFLSAYELPAAVLSADDGDPVHENGPFLALRQRHAQLVPVFHAQLRAGSKRIKTELNGRAVRWTVTEYPRASESATRRVIVLAQPAEIDGEEGSSLPSLESYNANPSPTSPTPPPALPSDHPHKSHTAPSSVSTQPWTHDPRFRALASGVGVMGDIARTFDWPFNPLGPIHSWPAELSHAVALALHCRTPATVIWGPDYIFIYNTAYASILGPEKHPRVFGQPLSDVWKELWPVLSPLVSHAYTGDTLLLEDSPFVMHRPIFDSDGNEVDEMDEACFTVNFIPIFLADGTVGGLYNPLMETTVKMKTERRMTALCQLATRLASERTIKSMMSATCDILRILEDDLPYVAAYTVASSGSSNVTTLTLEDTIGISSDAQAAPEKLVINLDGLCTFGAPSHWPIDLTRMVHGHEVSLHSPVKDMLGNLPLRGFIPEYPTHAALLPIMSGDELVGCLIVYIGPGQPINDRLKDFLDLLRRQLSTSASMVASYEQEVRKIEEMATLDRAKTSFFTNVSHELRTPLTLILGPVRELLRSKFAANSGVREQLGVVQRNADRLLRLVNTIMEFATAEAGRLTTTFRPTYLGPFTTDLAGIFRSAAERGGLQYDVDSTGIPPGLIAWIDRDKYEKIVYNVLSNALKYTLAGSILVSIYLDARTARFVFEVRDTGVGIPSEELGSVFEKFHRVTSTQGRSIEGTGIGLSYTRELVKIHGGDITVESQLGVGSVFRVLIPLGRDHVPSDSVVDDLPASEWTVHDPTVSWEDYENRVSTPSSLSMAGESDGALDEVIWRPLSFDGRSRARIIIADDNADMRHYIMGLLAKYCDIFPCADGLQALAELQACPKDYDLVLSDDQMPNMTGSELLAEIRADESLRAIPFIIVSANAGDEARVGGLARGADDYVAKPFQARELLLRVHTQLQSASIRNRLELEMAKHIHQLEESKTSFTRLCERLQVGIHRSNPDGFITWVNEKCKEVVGRTEAEWQDWSDVVHPDDLPSVRTAYFTVLQTKIGFPKPIEMRIGDQAANEGWRDILYDIQPEFSSGADGDLLGWVGVWYDVSSLRKLQREVIEVERAHAQEAERSRELQEQFIDITCHELRNPLNAIYNSAALLGESLVRIDKTLSTMRESNETVLHSDFEVVHAEIQENIESANTIVFCAHHQKRITDDVLNVSKLSAGLMTLNPADFAPCNEVMNTVRMFRDQVAARGVQLHFERDESVDALQVERVWGDSGRFIQVIVNLISNAIKFTEPAPRRVIRVRFGTTCAPEESAEADEDAWPEMDLEDLLPMCRERPVLGATSESLRLYIAIADSGLGMTDEEQVRLFQRFVQASPRTYGEFGGSGLGLYVSRMLVELQGGKIHLQSKRNVGTALRFFVTVKRSAAVLLPVPPDEMPSMSTKTVSALTARDTVADDDIRRMHVLVVEDNMINQRLLAKLLANLGCTTRTCSNGQECVDLLVSLAQAESSEDTRFDLVLMDLEMPVLDGLGATQRIRELEAQGMLKYVVPVVAVSGNARSEWTDHAREAGMNDFVRKPYSKAELDTLLTQWRPAAASMKSRLSVT